MELAVEVVVAAAVVMVVLVSVLVAVGPVTVPEECRAKTVSRKAVHVQATIGSVRLTAVPPLHRSLGRHHLCSGPLHEHQ